MTQTILLALVLTAALAAAACDEQYAQFRCYVGQCPHVGNL